MIARLIKNKKNCVLQVFVPNPGLGRLPLDSFGGDVEIAGVFAPVLAVADSFVSVNIFWNPATFC